LYYNKLFSQKKVVCTIFNELPAVKKSSAARPLPRLILPAVLYKAGSAVRDDALPGYIAGQVAGIR
jgi:hypothetical protein